jgi:hypothetical protein
MDGKGVELIAEQWDVFSPVLIDDSTEYYQFQTLKPLGDNQIGKAFGVQSPIEFLITDSQRYLNLKKSYIQMAVQLQTSSVNGANPATYPAPYNSSVSAAYPPGTPIAMEFDAARLFNRCELIVGSSNLESTSVYHDRTCMIRDLLQIDGAYSSTRAANAATITDMYLLDSPGNQCQTTLSFQSMSYTGTPTMSGTWYPNVVSSAASSNGSIQLVSTGAAYGLNVGNIVANPLYNEGFARRAALSDAGKLVFLRIPLERIYGFAQLDRVCFGTNILLRLYPQPNNNLIFHAQTDINGVTIPDGQLTIQSLDLMLAAVKPSLAVQAKISEQLIAKTSQEVCWQFGDTYSFNIPSGVANINQIVTSISERPQYIVFSFMPSSFLGSQLYPSASSWQPYTTINGASAIQNQTCFSQAYLQLGSSYFPMSYYWTFKGDNARVYQEYLDVTNRTDPTAALTPSIGYNDMFNSGLNSTVAGVTAGEGGYFMLIFDLRHISSDATSVGQPQQVILNANLYGQTTQAYTLYCTVFVERLGQVSAVDRQIVVTRK